MSDTSDPKQWITRDDVLPNIVRDTTGRTIHLAASTLRAFAQFALTAAWLKQCNLLSDEAQSLYGEWAQANEHARHLLGDFDDSVAGTVTRRALGMLLRPQIARDAATDEVTALLREDDAVKNLLADGDWSAAAEAIARACIGAYHAALVEAVR